MGSGALPIVREGPKKSKAQRDREAKAFASNLANVAKAEAKRIQEAGARGRSAAYADRAREKSAAIERKIQRLFAMDRDPQASLKQKKAMEMLLATNREAARRLGLNSSAVRGHMYPDGRVIVQLQVPYEKANLIQVEEALRGNRSIQSPLFPAGTFVEGNILFDPAGEIEKYPARYRGQAKSAFARLQMWGSQHPTIALFNLDGRVKTLQQKGFNIESYLIRTSVTIDGSQPFQRVHPPVGGSKYYSVLSKGRRKHPKQGPKQGPK